MFTLGRLLALMMEAVRTSETTVNFYKTIRRKIPETFSRVLYAASIKMAVLWVVALLVWCKFTDVSEVLAASIIALMMEAASTSETHENSCRTTRRNNSEDSHLQPRR
jgi:hypothetical protein